MCLKRGNKRAKLDPIALSAFEVVKLQPRASAAHIHHMKIIYTPLQDTTSVSICAHSRCDSCQDVHILIIYVSRSKHLSEKTLAMTNFVFQSFCFSHKYLLNLRGIHHAER